MYDGENYTAPTPLNAPMVGACIAKVIESKHRSFDIGDHVVAFHGWQEYAVSDGTGLQPIPHELDPKTLALGALGLPGHTAYGALFRIGKPRAGETLLVSAAAGAVGSIVCQIGRIEGLRVVGIASGKDKCNYLTEELGLDAAIDRKAGNFADALKGACPNGVDIYFDNVAGEMAPIVLEQMRDYGRYIVCGTIAINRDTGFPESKDSLQKTLATALVKRLTIQGFIFSDFADLEAEFRKDVTAWLKSGDIKFREHVVDGFEKAPETFLHLFEGKNFGKLFIRIV
jgi:hypothetical protein